MRRDRRSAHGAMLIAGRRAVMTLALLTYASLPASAWAAGPQEAIQQLVVAVTAVVGDPALQAAAKKNERRDRIGAIIHDAFDFEQMARESLGAPWAGLTAAQRSEFTRLFEDRFERSYSLLVVRFLGERTTTYAGETIQGEEARVRTALVSQKDGTLPVDYRLTAAGGRWAVADVVVDGVSLTGNYRAQFSKILRTSSYESLLRRMRTPAE
jgi:phospholipid transport system substrate-binding protein